MQIYTLSYLLLTVWQFRGDHVASVTRHIWHRQQWGHKCRHRLWIPLQSPLRWQVRFRCFQAGLLICRLMCCCRLHLCLILCQTWHGGAGPVPPRLNLPIEKQDSFNDTNIWMWAVFYLQVSFKSYFYYELWVMNYVS